MKQEIVQIIDNHGSGYKFTLCTYTLLDKVHVENDWDKSQQYFRIAQTLNMEVQIVLAEAKNLE